MLPGSIAAPNFPVGNVLAREDPVSVILRSDLFRRVWGCKYMLESLGNRILNMKADEGRGRTFRRILLCKKPFSGSFGSIFPPSKQKAGHESAVTLNPGKNCRIPARTLRSAFQCLAVDNTPILTLHHPNPARQGTTDDQYRHG